MISPIFINAENLGAVLEAKIRNMLHMSDKRQRAREMRKLIRILRDLSLLPFPSSQLDQHGMVDDSDPTMLSYGVRYDGKMGVIITWDPTIKIQGDIT